MAKRVFVKLSLLSFMLCLGMIQTPESLKAASNFPYPQNRNYSFGFKPNPVGASWAADAATILAKWNNWKAAHVTSSGAGGFLRVQRDSVDGNDTVSEGISYGMLIAVYVDDQATFNGLWQYKQIHNDGLGLMNWKISSGGSTIGANSAPDADQDIAYSLYLAHYQWGSGGAFNYKALADAELTKVAGFDLDSNRIKSGDVDNSCRYPSYFFPNEYRVFGIQSGNASMWNSVRANCYATIAAARNAATGLLAEQCTDTGLGGGCSVSSSQYQYNSARIPFRMALDYVYYGDANASGELSKLNSHFGAIAPGSVVDCYNLNGTTCGSFNGGAFVGPAATGFMYGGGANLQGYYTQLMAMNNDARYFDGSLQILSLLLLSGNMPNFGDQGSMFTPTYTCTVTPYAGTPTTTPTTTPVTFAYIFEDFENGLLSNHYEYSTTPPLAIPAVSTQGISATQKHGGAYSNRIQTKLPTASDYGGAGFDSSYAPASGVMNFTGSTAVRFWIYTDTAVSVRISFREGNGVAGGDNEVWQSALVPVLTTNAWVQVGPLLISSFTEDIYNTCNPNCLTLGNNTFNLSSVKAAQISFNPPIAATANVYVDDIAFIPSVAPTMTPTKTPFANPFNQIYDDFESPLSLFSGVPSRVTTYADTVNGASAAWALDAITTAQGARSGRLNYNIGTAASYGAGGGFISPYANASLYVDATGAVSLAMWMNAPAGLKYNLTIQEAGTPAAPLGGADGEAWNSALLTGTGGWTWVVVDLGDFVEDPYNIICNPTGIAAPGPCLSGAAAGNGIRDVQAIKQVGIKIPGGQTIPPASGAVYFDNVNFITTWKTPTPSRSPTPGANTPTFTPTPTPSPSPTLTRSPTMTASPSASPTLSPTPTQASTLTASPGNTATFTASPSTTMTRTWTLTQTMSFSATNSPTPTNSPTITLSATPTRSPTASQTPSGTPTLTATRTATPSSTPNWTATPTPTNTPFNGSPTNTPTFTLTASPTPTYTRTLSHTSTWSPSSSATPSPSPTPSVTLTSSGTNSPTPTNTSLNTATATPTITWTFSVTNTPFGSFTFSPTVSGTPSNTPLATQTSTPTASPAASPSPTNTTSSTRSPTPAGTRSFTPSATPASSATTVISPTSTLTPPTDPWDPTDDSLSAGSTSLVILGITQTHGPHVLGYGTDSEDWFTSLLTGGNSYDLSALQSAGGTGLTLAVYDPFSTQLQIASGATAASLTFVAPYSGAFYFRVTSSQPLSYNFSHKELLPTLTPTPLSSSTATPTLSMTRTPTPGPTPVVTATPTYSSTAVAGTPLPTRDPNGPVLGVVAVPNPGLPQNVAVHLDRTVDKVELRLYSKAMVCVDQAQAGRSGPGWVLVPVPPAFLNNAAGTYYYAVSVESEGKKTRKNGVGQMVITK